MNPYDQATPGNDIIDLRDVVEERDRIVTAFHDAAEERDADAIAENEADPRGDDRCSNECVCTISEKMDADAYEDLADLAEVIEENGDLMDAAEITPDDLDYLRAVAELVGDICDDIRSAAQNEPVMILDSYFEEYAEQLADDIGAIDRDAGWPVCHIDWKAAAEALAQDYTEVTFGGNTYLWRAY